MSSEGPRRLEPRSPARTAAEEALQAAPRRAYGGRLDRDLDFLTGVTTDWVELSGDEDILVFAARRLHELVEDAAIIVTEYDAVTRTLGCRALTGPPEVLAAWEEAAGDLVGRSVPIGDLAFFGLTRGHLVVVPGGLDVVTIGALSPEAARQVEQAIAFREAWAMGFAFREELYGSLVIVARHTTDLPDPRIVEVFVNQATVALQRRRAEENRRESERRFRELADQIPQVVIECDRDGRVTFANRVMREVYGVGAADLAAGVNVADLLSPADRERAAAGFQRVLAGEAVLGEEFTSVRSDGGTSEFAAYLRPVMRGDAVVGALGLGVDITERKRAEAARQRLEAELQHAEKLESLAVLAGGLAHDFNNLLVAILGNAELALTGLKNGTPSYDRVSKIQRAARRAAELTSQLLDYSGRRHLVLGPVDLNEIVGESVRLVEMTLRAAGEVRVELATALPAVDGDAAQIGQVVTSLLTNAGEAMAGAGAGGGIAVRTGVMRGDDPSLADAYQGAALQPERYAYVEVEDHGPGMDEATRAKVFDPFFTTKFPGRGLGLAAVLGIVRTHRGAVTVRSAPDRGTTFRVLFRLAAAGGS